MLQSIGPKFCETVLEYSLLSFQRCKNVLEEIEDHYLNKAKEQPVTGNMMPGNDAQPKDGAGGVLGVDGNVVPFGNMKDGDSC